MPEFYQLPEFRETLELIQIRRTLAEFLGGAYRELAGELEKARATKKLTGEPVDPMVLARSNRHWQISNRFEVWTTYTWEATVLRDAATPPVAPHTAALMLDSAARAERTRDDDCYPEDSPTYPHSTLGEMENRFRNAKAVFHPLRETALIDAARVVIAVRDKEARGDFTDFWGEDKLPQVIREHAQRNAADILAQFTGLQDGQATATPHWDALSPLIAGMAIDKYPTVRKKLRQAASVEAMRGLIPPTADATARPAAKTRATTRVKPPTVHGANSPRQAYAKESTLE